VRLFLCQRKRGCVNKSLPLIDLCVAAALDAVKSGVTLPWGDTKTPTEGTASVTSSPSATSAPGEVDARVLIVENEVDAWDEPPSTSTDDNDNSASSEPEQVTPEHPPRVISFSNFEKALKEITPSSSESLGTLSELRKWNDEFGEGKREKRRNMWGKGSFGFVEKGEGQGQIKIAANSTGSTSGRGRKSSAQDGTPR
jgi:hypothetical protein